MAQLLIAHAEGEERLAEALAEPLEAAGFAVSHRGTVLVGDSVVEDAAKALASGAPVILCATIKAMGTEWPHRVVNAARGRNSPVFVLQVEREAYVGQLAFSERSIAYWQNAEVAIEQLLAALNERYPVDGRGPDAQRVNAARERYRALTLEAIDIIDLANLPEMDRNLATRELELRRLYVPLRVRTEAEATEDPDARLQQLERRRQEARAHGSESEREADADEARPRSVRDPVALGERLAASRRLVVLGDPGAGKTTMLRWIATAYLLRLRSDAQFADIPDVATLPDEDLLPVIIRCRDLDESTLAGSLEDMVRRTLRKAEMSDAETDAFLVGLGHDLRAGRALLLIDGLDEIQDAGERVRFCGQLEQIHIAYPNAPMIVTSRIVGYREMGDRIGRGFEHVTVADLSRDDKDDFARRWCAVTEPPDRRETTAEELIADIHSADRIERLTGNPMLLTTMALVKRKVGKLPNRRAELYGDAVEVLLRWRREVDEPIDHREALPQLQYVAFAMCAQGVQQLPEDEVIELLERMREEYPRIRALGRRSPQDFLELLERRTAILVQAGRQRIEGALQPVYEFRHLTFQEYLAATALMKGRYPGRDPSVSLADAIAPLAGLGAGAASSVGDGSNQTWHEPLRLCIAVLEDDDVDDAMTAVLTPLDGEDTHTARARAALAASCLTDEPNITDEVADLVLNTLADLVAAEDARSDTTTELESAVLSLSGSPWAGDVAECLRNRFASDESGRRNAFAWLYALAVRHDMPRRASAVAKWIDEQSEGLVAADPTRRLDAALKMASVGVVDSRQAFVINAVWRKQDDVLDPVRHALSAGLRDADPHRHACALAISNVIDILRRSWLRPDDAERAAVDELLKQAELPADTRAVLLSMLDDGSADHLALLFDALRHEDAKVRLTAANRVAFSIEDGVADALAAVSDDPDVEVRRAVARGLAAQTGHVGALSRLARDGDSEVRQLAFRALANQQDAAAAETVLAAAMAGDPLAHQSLASLEVDAASTDAIAALEELATSGDASVRQAAVRSLGRILSPEVRETIELLRVDPEPLVRRAAIESLLRRPDTDDSEALEAIKDEDPAVRLAAVQRLRNQADPSARTALLTASADADSEVRTEAVMALIRIADPEAVASVRASLREEPGMLRRVLSWRSEKHFLPIAIEHLGHPDRQIREAAMSAVARMGCDDEERVLLSSDLDGIDPFVDTQTVITGERIEDAAAVLSLSEDAVRSRYDALAERFGLRITP